MRATLVISTLCMVVTCAEVRRLATMCSAMRMRMVLIGSMRVLACPAAGRGGGAACSDGGGGGGGAASTGRGGGGGACCWRAMWPSRSCFVMRPPAPVPFTLLRSMEYSRAMRRTSGESGPVGSGASADSSAGGGGGPTWTSAAGLESCPTAWAAAGWAAAGWAAGGWVAAGWAATGWAATGWGGAGWAAAGWAAAGWVAAGWAAAGWAAAGEAAGAVPPPSSMRATTVLMPTVFPSSTMTSESVPAAGDGISVSTLSVEISNSGSSRSTWSPGFFSHLVSVPSTMLSPIWGITTSVMCNPLYLAIKYAAEMRGQALRNRRPRGAASQLRHGSHGLGEAARNNILKIAQVGRDVERETVRSHPSADVHADGGDFALAHPDARQFGNTAGLSMVNCVAKY